MNQIAVVSGAASRRPSTRTVPTGMGKVFPSEDEAEEMFNNECLADLKAGRCQVPTDPNRVSTLMYRNSLCPPHLKSSYPAEMQFLPTDGFQEDDIKGQSGDCDTASLLSDKQQRKSPTQSIIRDLAHQHASRPTSQNCEAKSKTLSRNALKELNDGSKKPGTPSRLFSHFFTSKPKDENTLTPPNHWRLSFFNSHFVKKEPH